MRRSITAPVRIKTENEFRAMAHVRSKTTGAFVGPHMQTAYTREMRGTVTMLLSQLPKPRQVLADGTPNRYHVHLTRIAPGQVDRHDNLGASFKAVVDAIATWLCVDDADPRVRWSYDQQGCPFRMAALRIEVEDLEPGVDVVLERGNLPKHITAHRPRGSEEPRPPKHAPTTQAELVFREVYACLPHEQDGGDPVLTPLAMSGDDPPRQVAVRIPASVFSGAASVRFAPGSTVTLERALGRVDGAEAWIYSLPEGAADTQQTTNRRTGR